MDISKIFSQTGYKVKENRFLKAPPYPYIVFTNDQQFTGHDFQNVIVRNNISIELYSETINEDDCETKVEEIINSLNVEFDKTKIWIDSEKHFQTVYDFEIIEKEKR